jgi:IclR family transcriptional regulator, acetate operon repressor
MTRNSLTDLIALTERLIDRSATAPAGRVRDHADALGLPLSTAHRHVATLIEAGMVQRTARGRYGPGPRLLTLLGQTHVHDTLTDLARPVLADLAASLQCTAHLGVLDNQMVSYLAKSGRDPQIISREGMQLEAYCSALGKVLLSGLDRAALDAYLAEDEFVALTPHTKVSPAQIAAELEQVRLAGYALDRQEICEGLFCLAVPVFGPAGRIVAAISVSRFDGLFDGPDQARIAADIRRRVDALSQRLGA